MRLRFDPFRPRDPQADAMGVFVPALVLTGLGLVCVYSFGGTSLWRQAVWAVIAIGCALVVSRVPLERLRRAAVPLLAVCGVLLLYALLFAPRIAGTHRWIVIPSVGFFQPSELAKIAAVLFLAHRLADRSATDRAVLVQAWPVMVLCLLVLLAPDLGTAAFLAVLAAILLLIGGARIGRVLVLAAGAIPVLLLVASRYPYMQSRLEKGAVVDLMGPAHPFGPGAHRGKRVTGPIMR